MGAQVAHYVPDKPDDVEEQIALVDRAIAERPDAIVFVPVHATAVNGSVRKINTCGIPLVNILNRLSEGGRVTFVGADDYRLAHDIASYLFRHIGGKGDIVIVEGVPAAITSRERLRGFRDAAGDWPGIRIVATRTGDYQRDTARRVMAEILEELPRIEGILAANDSMALGIIDALESAGRRVPVIGVNAIPEAITEIKNGRLLATVDFDAMKIASIATEAAIRHLRGEAVPSEIELPVEIVDKSNYLPWDKPLEARVCPNWDDIVK